MDGSFACPECGSTVAVRGLAPGRQVRCGFCQRLLEVPYLPRVPVAPWKRQRFTQPKWVPWAWSVLGVVAVVILIATGIRTWRRHRETAQEGSIHKLIESSRRQQDSGHLNQALIDLDAALELARNAEPPLVRPPLDELKTRRQDLARRDAASVLNRLVERKPGPAPLGDWLNLIARARHDPDLAPLEPRIQEQFRAMVQRQADSELSAARRARQSGQVVASLRACDRIAKLLAHLPPDSRETVRRQTEALVTQLVATHGVVVEMPEGHYVFGSQSSYLADMLPVLIKGLEAKDYLPHRAGAPWGELWKHAKYQLRLDISEQHERNYLATENRLTRITARLALSTAGTLIWPTAPTALTMVPLPNLSAYQASRLAASPRRKDDLERLLYDNARAQILEKFSYALMHMPACP
ncbi:MAG TPA: hypothetical protein VFF52_07050 [Isosphaeraceae bacterium]|nr:hypothetical protein [Isosphaeraceae bacterium]